MAESAVKEPRADVVQLGASEDKEELVDKPVVLAVAVELVDKAAVQEDAEELVDKPVVLAVAVDKAVGLGDKAVVVVELVEKAASFKRGFNNTSN